MLWYKKRDCAIWISKKFEIKLFYHLFNALKIACKNKFYIILIHNIFKYISMHNRNKSMCRWNKHNILWNDCRLTLPNIQSKQKAWHVYDP